MLKEQYVTASEVARKLAVPMDHFRWLARSGKIPPGEKLGKERLYSRDQVESIVEWYAHYRAAREGMAWKQVGDASARQGGTCC